MQRLGRPVGQTVGASVQRRKQPGNAAGCPGQGIDVIGHGTVHGVRDAGLMQLTQAQANVGKEAQVQLGHVGWLHFPVRRQLLHGARGDDAQHVHALAALPGHDQKMPGGPHGQRGRSLKGTGQPGTGLGECYRIRGASWTAFEQGCAQCVFQNADLSGQRWLADEEPFGGTPEIQFFGQHAEVMQLAQRDGVGHGR